MHAVLPHPHVVGRDHRGWLGPHVGPAQPQELLNRIRFGLDGQIELAVGRLGGRLERGTETMALLRAASVRGLLMASSRCTSPRPSLSSLSMTLPVQVIISPGWQLLEMRNGPSLRTLPSKPM